MAHKIKGLDEKIVAHKDILFDILSAHKVNKFNVSFDGSGDSGGVDDVDLEEHICNLIVKGVERDGRWEEEGEKMTVRDVLEEVCYDTLEHTWGGWEIDSGSYGTFTFDVKNRKVHLDFNERIEDVNNHEYEF